MEFTAADLFYSYPNSRSPSDDPHVRGVPDSSLLNRHERYEVLYFLSSLMRGGWTKDQAKHAERLLHKAPSDVRSHANLKQWIIDNWSTPI